MAEGWADSVCTEDTAIPAPVVEPGDAEQLAAAVSALLDDPDRRAALGAAGRARALERYSWTSVARATADVYDEAIRRFAGKEQ